MPHPMRRRGRPWRSTRGWAEPGEGVDCPRGVAIGDAREGTGVLGEWALRLQRPVFSAFKESSPRAPEGQCLSSQVKLDPPVLAGLEKAPGEPSRTLGAFDLFHEIVKQSPAERPVDRPAIVRVDQAQVP